MTIRQQPRLFGKIPVGRGKEVASDSVLEIPGSPRIKVLGPDAVRTYGQSEPRWYQREGINRQHFVTGGYELAGHVIPLVQQVVVWRHTKRR